MAMAANTNPDRPNILMIFSDDQGFSDVGWRNKKVRTPNLDRLSAKGIRVEGAYSQVLWIKNYYFNNNQYLTNIFHSFPKFCENC